MVPCPWLTEVADYAKAHPDADLGLHLTLTSEWKTYRWGPVESKDKVPSLLDPSGYLWPEVEPAVRHIKPEEAEREIRAQIERALAMGIHPTHLDSHMGMLFSRGPICFAVYVKVAHEYKLPFLAVRTPDAPKELLSLLSDKDVILDSVVIAGPQVGAANWKTFYSNAIKNLKPGVTRNHRSPRSRRCRTASRHGGPSRLRRGLAPARLRRRNQPRFQEGLEENHIILIHWKDLKKLVQ